MLTLTQFIALYFLIAFFTFLYILYLREVGDIPFILVTHANFLTHFIILGLCWPIFLSAVLIFYLILRFK